MGRFRKNDRVSHGRFGAGVIRDARDRYTIIEFDDGHVRKFVTELLQIERSDLPPLPMRRVAAPGRRELRLPIPRVAAHREDGD